jgi:hypothetical protein
MRTNRVPRAYAGAATAVPNGVTGGQVVADTGTDGVVVFLIGMRVNRWRKVRSWWPVMVAMPRMLAELEAADAGLLGAHTFWNGRTFLVVQYWRSAEELGAYARDPRLRHAPAWGAFNKAAAATGDVGIFHETYIVPGTRIESLYGNMTPFGLGKALGAAPRGHRRTTGEAHQRLATTDPEYIPDR